MALEPIDPWRRVYSPFLLELFTSLLYTLLTDLLGLLPASDSGSVLAISTLDGVITFVLVALFFTSTHHSHFNPAVTISMMATRQVKLVAGAAIIFAQLFGAFFGAVAVWLMLSPQTFADAFTSLGVVQRGPTLGIVGSADQPPNSSPPSMIIPLGDGEGLHVFSNRFQSFVMETVLSTLVALPYLLQPRNNLTQTAFAACAAATRAISSAIAFKAFGQVGVNLARTVANNTISSIVLLDDRAWRLTYISFFAAIASTLLAAPLHWVMVKIAREEEHVASESQR